jgi:hypothetical protein
VQIGLDDGSPSESVIIAPSTWQGVLTSSSSITLPSRFATNEMPPGVNGFTVAEQIFVCGGGGLFCDNYVTGGGTRAPPAAMWLPRRREV